MKKIYPLFFVLASALSANAQLTQANHAPVAGDNFTTYQCDTVAPGSSGANQTWNFAVSTHSSIVKAYNVTTNANTAYPSASVSAASSANNTSYLASSANSLLYYGGNLAIGQVLATLIYTTPAIVASYPMSLNTTSFSAISGSINVTAPIPANGTFSGNSIVSADATGTLSVAGYTFTNITRVVSSQTLNTTVAGAVVFQTTYDYYDVGNHKFPVFSIATATANLGMFGTSTQTIVTRLSIDGPNGISQNSADRNQITVYPNPSNSEMNFVAVNKASTLSVFDLTGKLIDSRVFVNGSLKLDVSSYNKGIYIYRVSGSDNQILNIGKITVID